MAKALRRNQTDYEKKLWLELRQYKKSGFHFRRQAPIGQYIVDFVCLKQKLIIEVDGEHHGTDVIQKCHDVTRDAWLNAEGYRVIRFWNGDIFEDMRSVLNTIDLALPLEGGGAAIGGGGGGNP